LAESPHPNLKNFPVGQRHQTIQPVASTSVIQLHFRLIFSWCFSTASLLGASRRQKHKSAARCRVYSSALRQIHQWGTFEVPLALIPQDYEMNEHREIWAIRYVNQPVRFLSLSYASLIHQYISFILKK